MAGGAAPARPRRRPARRAPPRAASVAVLAAAAAALAVACRRAGRGSVGDAGAPAPATRVGRAALQRRGAGAAPPPPAPAAGCPRRSVLHAASLGGLGWLRPSGAGAAAAALAGTEVFRGEIVKSASDARSYQAATLGNGLRVLLVSDPETTTSSAALSVHAGFYLDPDEIPGIAHFCEHMLFLGNEEYPEEDGFKTFLAANGGSQNAFTTEQDTTYFFDVLPGALEGSLSQFGAFFKAPLFTSSATDRELNAIESEDAKNKQNDGFRLNQLSKSLAVESHPMRKFGTGNRETLQVEAQKRGLSIRDALLDFFKRHYDAGLMSLVVVGKEPAPQLLGWVEKSFGGIPNKGSASPYLKWQGVDPFPPGPRVVTQAVPISEQRSLSISWPLVFKDEAERLDFLRSRPYYYVGAVLGHEGVGSLLSLLKRRGLVNALSAGVARSEDNFAIFRVAFDVSEAGLAARDEIFEATFAVLEKLRGGIPSYVFRECRDIAELDFRFAEKIPARDLSVSVVENLQERQLDPSEYLSAGSLLFEPRRGSLQAAAAQVLARLTPDRAVYSATARSLGPAATESERWYGTRYSRVPIADATVASWQRPRVPQGYQLPAPNPFVPKDLGLRSPQAAPGDRARVLREAPALRRGDDRWRVFFKPDRVFATPKASVQVLLHRPADSRADQVAGLVWQLSLADRLTEFVYPAKICQLDYAVSSSEEGIGITVGGYSDKLGLFLEEIVTKVQEFSGPTPEEFARALDLVKRGQSAFDKQPPYSFATYNARLALTSPSFSIEFLRAQSARTTREDVVRLSERLRDSSQSFFGQALLHGNLDSADADRIQRTLERLQFKPQPLAGLARTRLTKLPKGQDNLLVTVHPNEDDVNNAIWSVYHTRQDTDAVVMTLLLQSILETPFFQQLRTEQQLGYIVQSSAARLTSGVGRLGLLAQSSTATPDRLMDAADGFMAKFRDVLLKLPAAEFARYKAALEELILTPAEALAEETSLWWKEISLFQYNWEQQAEEAEALRGVSQQDLLAFWDSFFAPSAPERQRFTTAVFAPKYRDAAERMATSRKAQGVSVVRNASSFADALPKWPMVDRPPPPVR